MCWFMHCMIRLQDYSIFTQAAKATGTLNTIISALYLLKHHEGDIVCFCFFLPDVCERGEIQTY